MNIFGAWLKTASHPTLTRLLPQFAPLRERGWSKVLGAVINFLSLWFLFFQGAWGADRSWPMWARPVSLPGSAKGKTLRGICFVKDRWGWVVGDGGVCFSTQDGGQSWRENPTGTQATLRNVRFLDEKKGWACGDGDPEAPEPQGHIVMGRAMKSGVLLETADAGGTWKKRWIPTNFEVRCVEVSAAPVLQVGISGGEAHLDGDITRSGNGGSSWSSARCFRALFDLRALDAKRWVAVGSGVEVGFVPEPKDILYKRKECRALFSEDGGTTWKTAEGSDGGAPLRGLACGAGGALLAVGDARQAPATPGASAVKGSKETEKGFELKIFRSADGGRTWQGTDLKAPRHLYAAAFALKEPSTALAAGQGCLLLSRDGGLAWAALEGIPEEKFCALASVTDGFWVAGGAGTAFFAALKDLINAKKVPPHTLSDPNDRAPTPAQRARVRKGDFVLARIQGKGPTGAFDFTQKQTVTASDPKKYILRMELAGKIPGQESNPGEPVIAERRYADLEEPPVLAVGEESEKDVEMDGAPMKVRTKRLPDGKIKVKGKDLSCRVIEEVYEGPMRIKSRIWFSTEVPLDQKVRSESAITIQMPGGGPMASSSTYELIDFGRLTP